MRCTSDSGIGRSDCAPTSLCIASCTHRKNVIFPRSRFSTDCSELLPTAASVALLLIVTLVLEVAKLAPPLGDSECSENWTLLCTALLGSRPCPVFTVDIRDWSLLALTVRLVLEGVLAAPG